MLTIDDEPVLVRGATYSPVPIGRSQHDDNLRVADFFVPGNARVWQRDLPLMRQLGLNSVRAYELRATAEHTAFLDLCLELNITVFAGFHLESSLNLVSSDASGTAVFNPMDVNLNDVRLS